MLAEAFVVCEEEAFVLFDRPAQRAAKHVALKLWNRPVIEKVSSIECAVAQEFVGTAVQLIGASSGDNTHLRAWTFSVCCAVGILHHAEFADGIHSEELPAHAAWRVINFRGAREFHSVQEIEIFLGAPPRRSKHVPETRVGGSNAASTL